MRTMYCRVLGVLAKGNHPGDIRKARAVMGHERYAHLQGCLVFSAKGKRPMADMMAGGDLDGDEFYVIYDQSIVTVSKPRIVHTALLSNGGHAVL